MSRSSSPIHAVALPGRGAWLHRDPECVELAERRRAFARALRVPGPVDPTSGAASTSRAQFGSSTAVRSSQRERPQERRANEHSMKRQQ